MRAGKLDRRVTIERAALTTNDFGEVVEAWQCVATVWAQQRPNRGGERFAAQQTVGGKVLTFHIRYRSDLTTRDRLIYDGLTYNILDIREIGRRVVSEIDAAAREG